MKLPLLATAFLLAVSAIPIDEWNRYKAEHNKVYTSKKENDRRLEQYLKNKEMVEEHNRKYERGETTYTMGINQFSDWFPEEIDKILNKKLDKKRPRRGKKFDIPPGTPVPKFKNWLVKGAVTKVKNQGNCLSDYAFASAGALEGLMFITRNRTITDLSTQQLVDCLDHSGCDGGLPENCFAYVATWGGIDTDESYPYVAEKQKCRAASGTIAANCSGYVELYSEEELTRAVGLAGPAVVNFNVDKSFMHYKGGIYEGNCTDGSNLSYIVMLAIGYGTKMWMLVDYWMLKNSWGTKWGDQGYVFVRRNVNMCKIGDFGLYPI